MIQHKYQAAKRANGRFRDGRVEGKHALSYNLTHLQIHTHTHTAAIRESHAKKNAAADDPAHTLQAVFVQPERSGTESADTRNQHSETYLHCLWVYYASLPCVSCASIGLVSEPIGVHLLPFKLNRTPRTARPACTTSSSSDLSSLVFML